jgi:hypothetical protein
MSRLFPRPISPSRSVVKGQTAHQALLAQKNRHVFFLLPSASEGDSRFSCSCNTSRALGGISNKTLL